ncbi:MAG: Rhs-family protein [Fibrobacteres bacterium]|nr:Rhs-family protein [Fibrobacterota bacterium]
MRCDSNPTSDPRLVGDPINVITGASTDRALDFHLDGPLPLDWYRYYDSGKNRTRRTMGMGHAHEFDRWLLFDVDGMRYLAADGTETGFPFLEADGEKHVANGLTLERIEKNLYHVKENRKPVGEFRFNFFDKPVPVTRVFLGKHQIEFKYGKDSRLESVIDSRKRWIEIRHDEAARTRLMFLHEAQGKAPRPLMGYKFDAVGNLLEGVDPYRNAFSYKYDAENRMIAKTDRRGYTFLFEYDAAGRCVRSRGQDGVEDVSLRYAPREGITEVTRGNGGKWTYFFDESKVLYQIIDPYGGVKVFKNDEDGKVVEEADPNGNVTKVVYDEAGNPVGKVTPFGRFASQGTETPNPLEHRVPANPVQYELGDLLQSESILAPTWKSEVLEVIPPILQRHFKIIQRPIPETGEEPADAEAKALRSILPPKPVKDIFGQLTKETAAGASAKAWAYDKNGNVAAYRDRDRAVFKYEYVSWNHLAKEIDPLGRETKYAYNDGEKLTEMIGPGGARSLYEYDLKDRLVKVKRHGAVKDEYLYDSADNLVEKRAGDGTVLLKMEIGKGNQIKSRRLASGDNHSFKYDEHGRYVEAATLTSKTTFAYDETGNRTEVLRDGLGVRHAYKNDALSETTILDKFIFKYAQKGADTLAIRLPGGKDIQIKLLGNGLVLKQFPNSSREWTQFDRDGRALSKVASGPERYGQEWVRRYAYTDEGDLLEEMDTHFGVTGFAYDAAHRLTQETHPDGRESAYVHDAGNNLIQQPGLFGVSLLEGNRLGTANGDTFEYDIRNHMSMRKGVSGETEYGYDSRGFLNKVIRNGQAIWSAEYDPLGRRISKTHLGKSWKFFWDSDRLMAEIDPKGKLRLYVYPDTFALTPTAFLDYDSVDADPVKGRMYFIFTNHLGAPTLVEDEKGDPVWTARIEAYGNAIVAIGQNFHMPLRFPGHYYDAETGLNYNRFRYYSPELGRYLQSDPEGISGGLNLYAYAEGNPLRWVDVRGLKCPNHPDHTDPDCQDCKDNESPPKTPYQNNNPKATADETRVGGLMHEKAQNGEIPGIKSFEGAAEIPKQRSGDYRVTTDDGTVLPADLYQPQSGNPDSIALNTIEKSGQAKAVVIELGQGKSGSISDAQANQMAQDIIGTPGHSVDRVIVVKDGNIISDQSR